MKTALLQALILVISFQTFPASAEQRHGDVEASVQVESEDPDPWPEDPAENFILSCSTPATLPKGQLAFRDDMIVIMGLEYGLTSSTQIRLWPLHPLVLTGRGFLSLNVKQRLLDREKGPLGLSLSSGISFSARRFAWNLPALVTGIGDENHSLNFNGGWCLDNEGELYPQYQFGGDQRISRRLKLALEYSVMDFSYLDAEGDYNDVRIFGIGLRFFGSETSFTVSLSKLHGVGDDEMPWLPWFTIYTLL